jgi:hypothetical protein
MLYFKNIEDDIEGSVDFAVRNTDIENKDLSYDINGIYSEYSSKVIYTGRIDASFSYGKPVLLDEIVNSKLNEIMNVVELIDEKDIPEELKRMEKFCKEVETEYNKKKRSEDNFIKEKKLKIESAESEAERVKLKEEIKSHEKNAMAFQLAAMNVDDKKRKYTAKAAEVKISFEKYFIKLCYEDVRNFEVKIKSIESVSNKTENDYYVMNIV